MGPDAVKRLGLVGTLLVLVSCLSPTDGCGCSPPPPFGVYVTGTASRATGEPVAGLTIRTTVFPGSCPATDAPTATPAVGFGRGATDPQGQFRYNHLTPGPLPSACVRLRVFADTLPNSVALLTEDRPGVKVAYSDALMYALIVP